jgi:hypothetical protein
MIRNWLGLIALLWPSITLAGVSTSGTFVSTSGVACSPVCATQDFSSDPFDGSGLPGPGWSVVTAGDTERDCHWFWSLDAMRMLKTTGGACSNAVNGFVYTRFNGQISQDGCAAFQINRNDNGDWGFGLVARDPSPPFTSSNTTWPTAATIICQNATCGELYLHAQNEFVVQECNTMPAFSAGDWFGACVSGTTVNVFHIAGPSDPGVPATTEGGGSWGTPDCTFASFCQTGGALEMPGCSTGTKWGVVAYGPSGIPEASVFEFDDFRVSSCQGL